MTRPDDLEPLDDVLVDLIAAEQRRPGPPPGTSERVRAAVLATVATGVASSAAAAHGAGSAVGTGSVGAAGTGAAGTVGGGLLGPGLVVVAALAATVGGTLFVASYEPAPPPAPIVAVAPTPASDVAPAPVEAAASTPPPALVPTPTTPPKLRPPPPPTPTTPATTMTTAPATMTMPTTPEARAAALAEERRLLASARQALQVGDIATALDRVAEHRARHPDGVLVEEREALTLMARARRGDDVDDEVAAFRARHPRSLFLEAIERSARAR